MKKLIAGAAGLAAGSLAAVIAARTAAFRPAPEVKPAPDEAHIDGEKAVSDLAAMLRCRTVSSPEPENEDALEFEKFIALLAGRFPALHENCPPRRVGRRGLLFCWKGRTEGDATVLMAHYDVVPADETAWSKPPFDGVIEDGVLWGRGTLDTKITVLGVLSAAEHLLKDGFTPKNDMYFAFGGDEETTGSAQRAIVETFRARGVTPALVVDEGGAVVENVFPGVRRPIAVIGTAEKGLLVASFTIEGAGGHASAPPPHTPVGKLAACVKAIEDHPFPRRLPAPVAGMFDTLGRHSSFLYRVLFANLWCTMPLLDAICKKRGGEINAMLRTTCAFTQMQGSNATNVIPTRASVSANLRLITGDSPEDAIRYLKKHVPYRDVAVKNEMSSPPSVCSETAGAGWQALTAAVRATWPEAIVTPYLMVACSDSRFYGAISKHVYRFSAMALTNEERGTVHGNDERIRTENIVKAVAFYVRLLSNC